MNLRGHRGLAAMFMLLALLLSATALIPAISQAQSYSITGLVSDCQTFLPVSGAVVSLVDATGVHGTQTFTTTGSGTFAFSPPASNYTISVTAPGHYPGGITAAFRFDGTGNVANKNVCLYAYGGTSKTLTVSVTGTSGPLGGANVQVYSNTNPTGQVQFITNGTSNRTTGYVNLTLFTPGVFEVRVYASGYEPYINSAVDMSTTSSLAVAMTVGAHLAGWATDGGGAFITQPISGVLYDPLAPSTSGTKAITATVVGPYYSFNAPAGTYRMVIGAKNYRAVGSTVTLTVGVTTFANVTLVPEAAETALTTVLFGARDWNNITVWRNLTLNPDSTLAGLGPAGLRDLRMQVNFTLGNGQTTGAGAVSAGDANAFRAWLLANGPAYTTTDGFLLLNSRSYISATGFSVSVSNSFLTQGEKVWVNTSTTYQVKSKAWITYGQPKYYLNMTVFPDTNTTVYHNETYIVELPTFYEMVSDTLLPNPSAITFTGYHRITVDPGLNGQAIQMILQQSLTGIARAKVIGPSGKFYVVNSAYQNYQAYVANNTAITFSAAETSNPPSNDSSRDNFTWKFLPNGSIPTPPNNLRYGIQPSFTFPLAGPYVVNLTAIGSGGNVSYRNITIWADGLPPTANFKTNVTGSGSAVGASLHYNQGTTIKFDGSLSTDQAYSGKAGVLVNTSYAWDFNGDHVVDATGRVVSWTFNKPGSFTVSLNLTDSVGNKGRSNATLTITVNDTQAPSPGFTILDPTNDFAPVTSLTEMRNYTFNASKTTDNYDSGANLTYNWTIPGPLIGMQGNTHNFTGINVTFGWSAWNLSYQVKLVVKDRGFGSGKPNAGTYTQNISVQIDPKLHPDLFVVVGSAKLDNSNPESGQTVTVTLNVTNKAGWGTASQIYVTVTESGGGETNQLSPTWTLADKNGTALTTLAAGATATMSISFAVTSQGNKTLTITVADRNEPYTHVTSENKVTESIVVKQAAWVNYAIYGSVVAVFAVVIFAMYYRRKVKAGDWQPRFRRARGEKGEGGKEKPRKEKEVKEEKRRL